MSLGSFFRKLSVDSKKFDTASDSIDRADSTGMSSIFTAPGKFLDSVNSKTGSLVSDLNQKLDLSGKFDTLKQASVTKLEHVVQATGATIYKQPSHSECSAETTESHRHPNPFNESPDVSTKLIAREIGESDKQPLNVKRRQSTNAGTPPPRPPPPTMAALNRAISFDSHFKSRDQQPEKSTKLFAKFKNLEPSSEVDEDRKLTTKLKHSSEGDSSASEYGADGDEPIYEPEHEASILSSESKIDSRQHETQLNESYDQNKVEHMKELMNIIVPAILEGGQIDEQRHETELQDMLGTSVGRMEFVKKLLQESTRNNGQLSSRSLPLLLDKLNYLLAECQTSEDFAPAKKLLKISLLYYIEDESSSTEENLLFNHIKEQPIWQSLRFWNACFFQSVQEARMKQTNPSESQTTCFEQLKSYFNTMNFFGLHENLKEEFLRKQSILFDLTDDQIQHLHAIISEEH